MFAGANSNDSMKRRQRARIPWGFTLTLILSSFIGGTHGQSRSPQHPDDSALLKPTVAVEEDVFAYVGANNGALRDGKQSMYEGGLKVPTCAVWPGKIAPGSKTDYVAMTMDLFPTILELAGAKIPDGLDGRSILPTLTGKPQAEFQRDMYWIRREGNLRYNGFTSNAVRRGDWKLVRNSPFTPLELFNLKDDPKEQNDLATKNRAKFNELSKLLRLQTQRGGAVPWQ